MGHSPLTKPGRLRRIVRLPKAKLWLRLEAAVALLLARVALKAVPFPTLAAHIGKLRPPTAQPAVTTEEFANTAQQVAQAVNAAACNAPIELVCLPRALAAWHMLHRRGVPARLHFGKPRANRAQRQTHAWLTSAGVEVTGYPVANECVEIGYFARPENTPNAGLKP